MKISSYKSLLLLGLSAIFITDSFAQRTGERRPSINTPRSFTPGNNSRPERINAPQQSRPPREFNTSRPANVQAPQTPRPSRDLNNPRPVTSPTIRPTRPDNNGTIVRPTRPDNNNTVRPTRPQPAPQTPIVENNPGQPIPPLVNSGPVPGNNLTPVQQRPPVVNNTNNNNRPGSANRNYNNNNYGRGRGGNNYVYNNYRGNNYYTGGYYNRRPRVVYNAYSPSWRYNYYPRRFTPIYSFPFAYNTIFWGGNNYRYYDGLFYEPFDSYYRVAIPPIGIYINTLPIGYRRIMVRDYPYYYYNGTYYNQANDRYTVVQPPLGAIVESIPDGYETIVIDGETYYKVDDVQYKPIVQDNGEIWYEVIKVG